MKKSVPDRRRVVIPAYAAVLVAVTVGNASAQVQLDRFFPPVATVGVESTIKAEGKFPSWPPEVICDRAEIDISAGKESGSLKVVVPPDAAPGVAWIRMHDKLSASKLVPLLIEPTEPLVEVEPNNAVAEATKAPLPAVLVGRLAKSGDVDTFRFSVQAGQTLVISATAHRVLRSPMDCVLQLLDGRGNVLVQSDDARGLDPQIVHQVHADGEWMVRLFAFPETPNSTIGYAGSASFVYQLRVTGDGFVDHILPLVRLAGGPAIGRPFGWNLPPKLDVQHREATIASPPVGFVSGSLGWQWQPSAPVDSISLFESGDGHPPPPAPSLPCVFSGHIAQAGEVDRFRFHVQKGVKYRATVHSRKFGFRLDSVLRLVNPVDGSELARNDDSAKNQYDAAFEHLAKADGEVELQISDLLDAHGPRLAYSVVVVESKGVLELSLAADHFVVKAGESVDIPVSISRRHGFQGKLQITAEGLPEGVQAAAVVSDVKGDTAKSVKLKLTAEKTSAFQGTIQLVAQLLDDDGKPTGETYAAVHALREIAEVKDVWLTVAAAKP